MLMNMYVMLLAVILACAVMIKYNSACDIYEATHKGMTKIH